MGGGGSLKAVIMQWTTYGPRNSNTRAASSTSHVCHRMLTERHGEVLWSWYWTGKRKPRLITREAFIRMETDLDDTSY
ncbi:hypothetical protein EYF80_016901 [Liparis tanakae]|uniref:Uncharacterized protein n=1 Tax=Liparis tanakae TaxID=230148 RepID=A0A4Z2I4N9_9TELE|nr:hypothetical protein EYF80_016901 [Liparis tanakae]